MAKLSLKYEIKPTTLPNFIVIDNVASVSLKDLSKEELEEYAEAYKQAIIQKHRTPNPKYK